MLWRELCAPRLRPGPGPGALPGRPDRLALVERFAGRAPKALLELGAGTGETATFLATAGCRVTALDISEKNFAPLCRIAEIYPAVTAIRGDYFTDPVAGKFVAVCLFETFGMGADREQRSRSGKMCTPGRSKSLILFYAI